MTASISRRAFIQWLPDEPLEPTTTLVLTSPQSRFIDIRLLHQTHEQSIEVDWAFAGCSKSSPRDQVEPQSVLDGLHLEQYRAFVDVSEVSTASDDAPDKVQHTVWTHTIDSRFPDVDGVQDQGDMVYVPALGLTIERGNMLNPSTDRLTDYVEGWLDDPVEPSDYTVLELTDESKQPQGLFIRLGPWAQGVARISDNFSFGRWRVEAGHWHLQAGQSHAIFPVDTGRQHSIGSVLTTTTHEKEWHWTVVESSDA